MENFTISLKQAQVSLEEMRKYFTNESYDATLIKQITTAIEKIAHTLSRLQGHSERDVEDFNRFLDEKRRMRNTQLSR
jgi:threonyl-tRNA synthetase